MIWAIVVLRFRTVVLMGGVGVGGGGGEAVVGRWGMFLGGIGLFESSRVYLFWLVGMGRLGCFSFGLLISRVLLGAGGMGLESFVAMFGEHSDVFLEKQKC